MTKLVTRIAIALVVLFAAASLYAATPGDVKIDDCVAKKSAVAFPHDAHAKTIACKDCHHNQPDLTATSGKGQSCGACHTAPEKAETPKCSEMSMAKNPFHKSCVDCHKAEVAKGKKAPTKCDECHPKA